MTDALLSPAWHCALPQMALLRVSGADALSFLHGQLTNEVKGLAAGAAQMNGYCTPKGRLLASFIHWHAPDANNDAQVFLLCHASVAAGLVKRLSMFVMRAKAKVANVTSEYALSASAGVESENVDLANMRPWSTKCSESLMLIGLPNSILIQVAPLSAASIGPTDDEALFELAMIQAGLPLITQATAEAFVPQMVNFELPGVGGVSFSKGCYPGQEVVARSHYRSTAKRRMFIGSWASDVAVAAGTDVVELAANAAEPNVVGQIVNCVALNGVCHGLIELQLAQRNARLHAAGSTALIAVSDPPYALELADK